MSALKKARVVVMVLLAVTLGGTTAALAGYWPRAAVLGGLAGAPAPLPKEGRAADRERIRGTWKQVHAEFEGADNTRAQAPWRNHWAITADTITILTRGGQYSGSWSYRLDPTQKPSALDLTVRDTFKKGTTYPSIYKLEGDRLTVCMQNFPERGRPRDFESRPRSGVGKFVYVRLKAGEKVE